MMLLKSFDVNIKGTDATPDGHRWHIQVSNSDVLDFSEKIKLLYQVQVVLLTS